MTAPCLICERVALWRRGENPYFIHESEYSIFVVVDHQFYPGYSLLLLKEHVRELHELSAAVQSAMFGELMAATRAIVRAFQPYKMNHASAGNTEPHVHWHIFPRYEDDSNRHRNPWFYTDHFRNHLITPAEAQQIAARIRHHLH